jgi:hypothetical protein
MVAMVAGLSMTRIAGLVAYGAGLLACAGRCWQLRHGGRGSRLFGLLAAVQLVLLLDMAFDWRWKLHELIDRAAMAGGTYDLRRGPQMLALLGLGGAAGIGLLWGAARLRQRAGAALALAGTILSVALRCAEVVSLHNADALLYASVGGLMVVAMFWLALGLATCLGAWIDGLKDRRTQVRRI